MCHSSLLLVSLLYYSRQKLTVCRLLLSLLYFYSPPALLVLFCSSLLLPYTTTRVSKVVVDHDDLLIHRTYIFCVFIFKRCFHFQNVLPFSKCAFIFKILFLWLPHFTQMIQNKYLKHMPKIKTNVTNTCSHVCFSFQNW